MITWMTRMSFLDTADDLSDELLIQTEFESYNLLQAMLFGETPEHWTADWDRRPESKMWYGYEVALAAYVASMSSELATRGFQTTLHSHAAQTIRDLRRSEDADDYVFVPPSWLEDKDVLRANRSNMMRRWPGQYDWAGTPTNWPYLWPFVDESGSYKLMVSKHDRALLELGERTLPKSVRERTNL